MNDPTRILIVEDSSTDAELASHEIRKAVTACVFQFVDTRDKFLAALESFRPDLIVSDFSMPHFDGMTALKLTLERSPLTPFIIWTGSLNEETAVECMKAGAVNYVLKDNIRRLGPAVIHALEEKQLWVERQRAETEIVRRANQLAVMNAAALKIQQQLVPDEIYRIACEELRQFGKMASIFRLENDTLHHFHTALSEELLADYVAHFSEATELDIPVVVLPNGTLPQATEVYTLEVFTEILNRTMRERGPVIDWLLSHVQNASILVSPFGAPNQPSGVFAVVGESLSQADEPAMMLFARQVSVALENARLFAAEQARRGELGALYDLARAFANTDSFDETLQLIVRHAVTILRVTFAQLALIEDDTWVVQAVYPIRNLNYDLRVGQRERLEILAPCRADLENNQVVILRADDPQVQANDCRQLFIGTIRTLCLIPLRADNRLIGLLMLGEERNYNREPFDEQKMNLARAIGDQSASAIRRTLLHAQTEQDKRDLATAYDATIEGWSRALDLRDKETEGHTQRVVEMTLRLARHFGFSGEQLDHIRRGALLHDIGKMGIPDAILLKPSALTEQEWEIMRRHPEYALMLLSPIDYLAPALDIPYCHHEKWDGTGYPRGLKGEEIPLTARLFAVVDVWDALTSDRPYRAAWPQEQALTEIQTQAGKHFDPKVVEAFLQLLNENA